MVCEENDLYKFFPKFFKFLVLITKINVTNRVTLIGNIKKTLDKNHRRRFLSRQPSAKLYSNALRYEFYKIEIKTAHLIAHLHK